MTTTGPASIITTSSYPSSSSMGHGKAKAVLQGPPSLLSTSPTFHSHHALNVIVGEEAAGRVDSQEFEMSMSSLPPHDGAAEDPVDTTTTTTTTTTPPPPVTSNTARRQRKRTPSQLKAHRDAERDRYHSITLEERRIKYAEKSQKRAIIRSNQRKEKRQRRSEEWKIALNQYETGKGVDITNSRGD